ncbi:MAG: hypothetical protein HC880_00415 [Bacteroidia bacterium]|nr:hypothetical protein [Bacteroidia bacterium]
MSKDPAFLFYFVDWQHGTRKFSFAEKGAYLELLCEQADLYSLSINDIKRILKNEFPIWETICVKFIKDEDGKFYNETLRKKQIDRKNYVKSRLKNLKKSHMEPHMGTHMGSHMENRNENRNENIKEIKYIKKRFVVPEVGDVRLYCSERKNGVDAQKFFDFYTAKGWMIGKNKMKCWKAAIRTWEKNSTPEKTARVEPGAPKYKILTEEERKELEKMMAETRNKLKIKID